MDKADMNSEVTEPRVMIPTNVLKTQDGDFKQHSRQGDSTGGSAESHWETVPEQHFEEVSLINSTDGIRPAGMEKLTLKSVPGIVLDWKRYPQSSSQF